MLTPIQLAFRLVSTLPIAYPKQSENYLQKLEDKDNKSLSIASCLPLVGIVLGGIIALVMSAFAASRLYFDPIFISIIGVLLMLALTRMMHIDAIADVFDAGFGGFSVEDRYKILKDPHIGVFGVIAVVISLMLYAYFFNVLYEHSALRLIILVMCLSRFSASLSAYFVKPFEKNGLGKSISRPPQGIDYLFVALSMFLAFLLSLQVLPTHMLFIYLVFSLVIVSFVPQFLSRPFLGTNGDVMGATIVISELLLYTLAICFL